MEAGSEVVRTLAAGVTKARARRDGPVVVLTMEIDGHAAEMRMSGESAVKLAEILLRHGKEAATHAAMAGM